MIKNLILILTITTLLPKTTIQQVWCGDREFFECLNQRLVGDVSSELVKFARDEITGGQLTQMPSFEEG